MRSTLFLTSIGLFLANPSWCYAQSESTCIALINKGLYDHYNKKNSSLDEKVFHRNFCDTYDKVKKGNVKIDAEGKVLIKGLVDIDASVNVDDFLKQGSQVCNRQDTDILTNSDVAITATFLNAKALETLQICMQKADLIVEVTPRQDDHAANLVTMTLYYRPPNENLEPPKIRGISKEGLTDCVGLKVGDELSAKRSIVCHRIVNKQAKIDLVTHKLVIKPQAELAINVGAVRTIRLDAVFDEKKSLH